MRPPRNLARSTWSPNGAGAVVVVTRNGQRRGYFVTDSTRETAARAIRTLRSELR